METIELGGKLDAKVLVFGAPKNIKTGGLKLRTNLGNSWKFFHRIGEFAANLGIVFWIEPNPKVYDCDFITDSRYGFELVNKVNSAGFGLHLDTAAML